LSFERLGIWQPLVLDILRSALERTATTQEIYATMVELTDSQKGSIRSALSRLAKKGIISRIERGKYKLELFFRKFRHTKRVIETHVTRPQNKYDIDIESTSNGLVPVTSDEDFFITKFLMSKRVAKALRKKFNFITSKFEAVINPLLIEESMRILASTDPSHPIFVGMTAGADKNFDVEWKISGSEFLDDTANKFDPLHEVEVKVTNKQGRIYFFDGGLFVNEDDFK